MWGFLLKYLKKIMPLKITLKPDEKVIISGAVIKNAGNKASSLIIENDVPVLRQSDIIKEEEANSPCSKIYFIVQLMYIDKENLSNYHKIYWELVKDVLKAAPSVLNLIEQISRQVLKSNYYKALKITKKLIEYEQEIINHAKESISSL